MTKSAPRRGPTEVGMLTQLVLPLAALVRGDLRELVTKIGLHAIGAMLERERTALCGPAYAHNPARTATRGGHVPSELTYGGRKVKMKRPQVELLVERRDLAVCGDREQLVREVHQDAVVAGGVIDQRVLEALRHERWVAGRV